MPVLTTEGAGRDSVPSSRESMDQATPAMETVVSADHAVHRRPATGVHASNLVLRRFKMKPERYSPRAVFTEINEEQHLTVTEWPNKAGWDVEIGRGLAAFMFQLDKPTWKALKRSMRTIKRRNKIGF
jgi:hypothetical protein